jgi:O-antigen ligase
MPGLAPVLIRLAERKTGIIFMKLTYQKIVEFLWLGLVALLPVSSFPLVAKVMRTSSVAPASLIFLGLLIVLWLPFYLYKVGKFPFQTKIVFIFFIASLISTALSYFYLIPSYKGNELGKAVLEGVATMVVGFFFYVITVITPNSQEKIQKTLRILNWSGAVMIAWSLIYLAIVTLAPRAIKVHVRDIQLLLSTSSLHVHRALGFTSEPSWLAHILNIVYLPCWLGAAITKFSAHSKKVWKFSFENVLLAGGVVTLAATASRAGWVAFFLVLAFLFIRLNVWLLKRISARWVSCKARVILNVVMVIAVVVVYLGIVFGSIFILSKVDPRMADVFSVQTLKQGGLIKYVDALQFGERVTYWQTGWRIFNSHPVFGVGLGNAGFYFQTLLPDGAWQLAEVRRLIYSSEGLMNVKSLWMRILAETGIVGFSVFCVFLIVTGLTAKKLLSSDSKMQKTIGWMGILMLIAFIIEGFSVDSFALPYIWFTTGLVAATWRWTFIVERG